MKEKLELLFEKMTPIINKISTNKFLQGLSGGMMATLPITVVGSFALFVLVNNLRESLLSYSTLSCNKNR